MSAVILLIVFLGLAAGTHNSDNLCEIPALLQILPELDEVRATLARRPITSPLAQALPT